jgi:hypothetical protein
VYRDQIWEEKNKKKQYCRFRVNKIRFKWIAIQKIANLPENPRLNRIRITENCSAGKIKINKKFVKRIIICRRSAWYG